MEKSGLDKNTIIVFTTDHTSFVTPEYKNTFGIEKDDFWNTIPLIVYIPRQRNTEIDANGRNSLGLTPTILDILNLEDAKNMFLGSSLFMRNPTKYEHIFSEGATLLTNKNGTREIETDKKVIDDINEFMSISLNL